MPWGRVFRFSDPLACRAAIWSADCELFPTAKGRFRAELTQIGMNSLWMHRIRVSLPQVNTVAVKPGRRAIGFLIEPNSSPLLHCGLEVLPGDIVVNGFDVTHQRSDANFCYGTMSLPIDDLDAAADAIIGRELPKPPYKRIIRPNSALMRRLLKLHKSVGQLAHDSPDILKLPPVLRALENELIHIMVKCLVDGAAERPPAAVVTTPSSRGLRNSWRQILTGRFISPRFAPRSASRSERFAPAARSILAWGRSVISHCAE